jgi:two-component system phosphate regulon sensor histidine kinase PhoR
LPLLENRIADLTARIFLKIIAGVICVLVVALAAVDLLASRVAERTYVESLTSELEEKSRIIAQLSEGRPAELPPEVIAQLAETAGGRLTIIAPDGEVLADSEANPAQMENHAGRPEFVSALAGTVGSDTRRSNTLGVRYRYVAIPVGESALRLAVPLRNVDERVDAIRWQLMTAVAVAFIPAVLVAALFARYVSRRLANIIEYTGKLARGELGARLERTGKDELGVLSQQLNETGEKLQKMFEQLQHEHVELEKLERVRKDFVINVSHELRTPLASIQGYTETLLEGALNDPEHNIRFLTIIRQNAERLGRLTADLMTLSRLELKTTKFQFASYRANELLADCIDSMRPMAEKKHVRLLMELAPEGTEVFCDSEAVHQVMSNLMDNALKYTPEGGHIAVSAGVIDGGHEELGVRVRDTGTGIPAEELPRLFERFYRVDKARSRQLGGTGLGLAIVKHLVRAMGGSVRVESEIGTGSTFIFTLPVHDLGLQEHGAVPPELSAAASLQ